MSEFDDAVGRIRGPQLDDFFPQSQEASFDVPTSVPTSGQVAIRDTSADARLDVQRSDDLVLNRGQRITPPEMPYHPPTFGDLVVEPAIEGAMNAAPLGMRMATGFSGNPLLMAGGEYVAQDMEEAMGGPAKSWKRGGLNVAINMTRIPGLNKVEAPLTRFIGRQVENVAQSVGYDYSAAALGEGEAPTARSLAGNAAASLAFGGVLGLHEAGELIASQDALRARRAVLPDLILKEHNEKGGSTFDPDGKNYAGEKLHSAPIFPDRTETISGRDLTSEDIATYHARNLDVLRDSRVKLGTWKDPDNGNHVLDLTYLTPSREEAVSLGQKYNQKSVFDLATGETISTGGTGELIGDFGSPLSRLPKYESSAFGAIRERAAASRDWLAKRYSESSLASETGSARLDALFPIAAGSRFNRAAEGKKTLGAQDLAVRERLAAQAAEALADKRTTFADWSAKMVESYGDEVTPHLKQGWSSGETAYARVMKEVGNKLPNTKTAMQLLRAGRDGEDWYEPMQRELQPVFGKDTDLFLRFVAATSPNNNIEQNLQDALKVYVQHRSGATDIHPVEAQIAESGLGNSPAASKQKKAMRDAAEGPGFRGVINPQLIMQAVQNVEFAGPKIRNFLQGMRGDPNAMVIDRWMQRYLGYKPKLNQKTGKMELPAMSDIEYEFQASFLRGQAEASGVTPAQFQERVWRGIKKTWSEARVQDTGEPYHVVVKQRHEAGLPLFDEGTMRSFNEHEKPIAEELQALFQSEGRVGAEAPGLGPTASAFVEQASQQGVLPAEGPKPKRALLNAKGERVYTSGLSDGGGQEPRGLLKLPGGKTLRDIHARDHEAGKAVFEAMGATVKRGKDTNADLKIYPLHDAFGKTREEAQTRVQGWLDKIGWRLRVFGPGEDGKGWTPPDFKADSYHNNAVWIYQPTDPNGGFRDYAYTLAWRATHEVAHAQTNDKLTAKYGGQGRRQGALGRRSVAPNGKPIEPLGLPDALRAVEWEHETFKAQRKILEKDFGVKISDAQFAKENQVNMADAVYRALSGDFTSPGDWGISPTAMAPGEVLTRAKRILRTAAADMGVSTKEKFTTRAGQEGSARLDSLLPIWAMTKVAQGVNTLGKFVAAGVKRFGEAVRPYLAKAFAAGRERALHLASSQAQRPAPIDPAKTPKGPMPGDRIQSRKSYDSAFGTERGQALRDMAERYSGDIEEQTRGVQSDPRRQELAEAITWDLSKPEAHLGHAPSSEELKSLTDLVGTLDAKLVSLHHEKVDLEPQGKWTSDHDAHLAETVTALDTANTILFGYGSELGRAMRTLRATWSSRNAGDTGFARGAMQRGVDPAKLAEIMRTHKSPLERYRAVTLLRDTRWVDLFEHAQYMSFLVRPATWGKSFLANMLGTGLRYAATAPAAGIDAIRHRGNRFVYANELRPHEAGWLPGLVTGAHKALETLKLGAASGDIAEGKFPHELSVNDLVKLFGGEGSGEHAVGDFALNAHSRILQAADHLWGGMIEEASINGFAFARAKARATAENRTGSDHIDRTLDLVAGWKSKPPLWLAEHAARERGRITMQAKLGLKGQAFTKFMDVPGLKGFLLPFAKVGINAMKLAFDYSPIGLGHGLRLAKAARDPAYAKEYGRRTGLTAAETKHASDEGGFDREASLRMGETALGTALMVPMLALTAKGFITGNPPPDEAERVRGAAEHGWNTIRVGDRWYSYQGLTIAPQLASIANAHRAWSDTKRSVGDSAAESQLNKVASTIMMGLGGVARSGFLQDINGLLSVLDARSPDEAAKLLGDAIAGGTPGIGTLDQVNRYVDPISRKTEGVLDPFRAAIPGQSQKLMPRLTATGKPIFKPGAIDPTRSQPNAPDAALNEAASVGYKVTPIDDKTVKLPGETEEKRLLMPARRALSIAKGRATRFALDKVRSDPRWSAYPPDEKRARMVREVQYYRQRVQSDAIDMIRHRQRITTEALLEGLQ